METQDTSFIEFVRFLDGARNVPSVQEQKHIIFDLLKLQAGDKVLDIGCGTGDDVRDIAQKVGTTGLSVGIDVSKDMIEVARKRSVERVGPVEFHLGSIYNLNFPDNIFDVTRCERLFEHLDHPVQALQEMIRVTRAGGRILVASPDMDTNMIDHPNLSVTRRIRHFECDRRPNGSAGHRLYGLFWDAGLTDIEVRGIVHMNTNYQEMLSYLDIRERAAAARDSGVISAEECAGWLAELAQAGQVGHFFMSTNHYIAYGCKAN